MLLLENLEFADELFGPDIAALYFDRYYMSWYEAKMAEEFARDVYGDSKYSAYLES
jgi:hypothetical protein